MVNNFLFHRVHPVRNRFWDPMDPKLFDRCIKQIQNKFDIVRIEDLIRDKSSFENGKYATIQFDDGYKDNIDFAADILNKHKVKASFYVVTDCIDNNEPTWTHILEHLFQYTKKLEIELDFDTVPEEFRFAKFLDASQRFEYAIKIKPYLKTVSHSLRMSTLEVIKRSFSDVQLPHLMMDWKDLQALNNDGHYIGSHTVTHGMLGTMKNEEDQKRELVLSGERIKQELGYFPDSISYPVGSYNAITKKLSKEAGYKLGLAVHQDVYNPMLDDNFEISRIELYNEPWWKTKMRISHNLERIKKMIRYR